MKKLLQALTKNTSRNFLLSATLLSMAACEKDTASPRQQGTNTTVDNGPYGSVSRWKSIAGDSIFKEELNLTLFYTEKSSPCDICHYALNYSLWNDYEYTYSTSKCTVPNDTLIMTDLATSKKAIFKRIK